MSHRFQPWRVRVTRQIEDWVTVDASTVIGAEAEARKLPGVVNVFPGMTLPGDEVDRPAPPPGAQED